VLGEFDRFATSMQLIYLDESKNDDKYPHYHMGAVCIDEKDVLDIEKRVAAIAESAFGTISPTRETELHAADIWQGGKYFKKWRGDFSKRLELLSALIDILSLEQVRLIDIQINCARLQRAHAPENVAFMFLCERANGLVKSLGSIGLLIGDRESDHVADRLSNTLSSYRERGTDFAFGTNIGNLVDCAHFTHFHLSRLLQLADAYTWFMQFQNRNRGSSNTYHKAVFDLLGREGVDLFPSKYKEWPKQIPAAT
jgi:hypothetical protein